MMSTFALFSKASGLEANTSKSSIYMSGIDNQSKECLLRILQMEEGVFPFRYLGVPLHSKKINSRDCRPLVDKIIGRIGFWSSCLLSYAGRIQLVRSVIGGMQNFWAQIFCLPKKLIKMVQDVCRSFIWTGKEGVSRKAAVARHQMVLPYAKGGLNLRDMYTWNKAAMLKHLWNFARKKDNLWVKWVHSYYMKSQEVQDVRVSIHASWSFKKIIKQRDTVDQLGGWEIIIKGNDFAIGKVYEMLIAESPSVPWGYIMIKNIASPSAKFITWLAIQNSLATKDRVRKWMEITDENCVMCNRTREAAEHLLFDCQYARKIRSRLFSFLPYSLDDYTFSEEILKINKINKKKTDRAKLIVGLWKEMISSIWMQRNRKIFDNRTCNLKEVIDCIVFRVAGRGDNRMREMLVTN